MAIKRLKLSLLMTDAGTQTRSTIYPETVEEYQNEFKAGAKFPPLVAFHDKAKDEYYLVDGFHRHQALEWNGVKEYNVDILAGDLKAAIKFALGRNNEHGLRRTNADKRYAVEIALKEFAELSSREIAEICHVSHTFVESVRPRQVATVATSNSENPNKTTKTACPPAPRRTGKDGKSYPVPQPRQVETPKKKDGPCDQTKLPIPPEILDAWSKADQEAAQILSNISVARSELRKAQEDKNPAFAECDFTDDLSKLDTLYTDLKRSRPFAVCFDCNGVNFKACKTCKHRGWISEHFYKVCVPEEKKKITKRLV